MSPNILCLSLHDCLDNQHTAICRACAPACVSYDPLSGATPPPSTHLEAQQHIRQVTALHLWHAGCRQQLLEVFFSTQPEGVAWSYPPRTPRTLLRGRLRHK
jgi:hypothetical protein